MTTMDELEFGREIHGKVCPQCGGTVVKRGKRGRAYCDWDGYVKPVEEEEIPYAVSDEEVEEYLRDCYE